MSELAARPPDILRDALLDSRQRWRDLVAISADIAFETDAEGRFVFVFPAEAIGWPADELIGAPSTVLLPEADEAAFDPFRIDRPIRNRRAWVRRGDGTLSWLSFSAAPLYGPDGVHNGARGVGRDVTELDRTEVAMARALRRSELIDHLGWHMRTEVMVPRMISKALGALTAALGAHGAMVVQAPPDGAAEPGDPVLHAAGNPVPSLLELALRHLAAGIGGPLLLRAPDGHAGMICAAPTRFNARLGVLVWRQPRSRPWTGDELSLLASAVGTLRMVLDQGAVQREMARQSPADALTGLYNRRAFTADLERRLDRLERQGLPGSLLMVDLDGLGRFNQARSLEAGDQLLRALAGLLRNATRPGDLLARLGGGNFAAWLDGMDQLAAAERADRLCTTSRLTLTRLYGAADTPSLSVAVVGRWPGDPTDGSALLRRAAETMAQIKHAGGGRWLVWHGRESDDV